MFKGVIINENSEQLTYLQFADDILLFIEGSIDSIKAVKKVLQCFQLLTGLKINFNKSCLYSCSKENDLVYKGADCLGCLVGNWPMTYLGAPLGTSSRKKSF